MRGSVGVCVKVSRGTLQDWRGCSYLEVRTRVLQGVQTAGIAIACCLVMLHCRTSPCATRVHVVIRTCTCICTRPAMVRVY